jgi:CHAD domain-containing protein
MPAVASSVFVARRCLSVLNRSLPSAEQGDVDSLHKARVATRRLRETLPLVASGHKGRKLDRDIRRITRALGPVRELDVALAMLDTLESAADVPRAAVMRLRQVLADERRVLREEMVHRLSRVDLQQLRKRLAAAHKRAERPGRKGVSREAQARAARDRAGRRATQLQAAMESAGGLYLPDRLHQVRVAVKKLRYALELSTKFGGPRRASRIQSLRKAQDVLGHLHDLEVLIARTRGVQGSPHAGDLKLSEEMDRLVRRLETECRQLHVRYTSTRKTLAAICDEVAAAARPTSIHHSAA